MNRRRIITHVIVFVLLGAIVNVAVAWGCALWSPTDLVTRFFRPPGASDELTWERRPAQTIAPLPSAISLHDGHGCSYQIVWGDRSGDAKLRVVAGETTFGAPINAIMDRAIITHVGYPLKTISGERWDFGVTLATPTPTPGQPIKTWTSGDVHRSAISFERPPILGGSSFGMLAWRPIWPGFAINTIFYAAILWLLFATPGSIRRRVRRFRGRCIHCGYDLRGHLPGASSDTCPECGRRVSPSLPGRGRGGGSSASAKCA